MAEAVKGIIRTLTWLIGAFILSFTITMILIMPYDGRLDELPFGEYTPFVVWGLGMLLTAIPLRRFINSRIRIQRRSIWEHPEQIRDKAINTPQFVGRVDRERGLLESTARMAAHELVNRGHWFSPSGVNYTVYNFRAEILDQDGTPREYIPVIIEAEASKFVGHIVDGDRVRVEGKFEKDGILHASSAYNYSTNSWVGRRK